MHQPTGYAQALQGGDLIIAPPMMVDPRFREAVIMITHHDSKGSYGLCLNKITSSTVGDLTIDIDSQLINEQPLYWGGPMHTTTVWMLHSTEWSMANTVNINDQWSMTSNTSMFHSLAQGECPEQFRIFCGFATWGADQLASEVHGTEPWTHESSWLIWRGPHSEDLLDVETDQLWSVSMNQCAQQAVSTWL
jgi:putative transcriptional regulator